MTRSLAVPALLALLTGACASVAQWSPSERRAVIVTLDGASEQVVEAALARGIMPNLSRLKARGAWPDYSVTNFPSKTAAGHAALWTGAMSDINGIAGNKVLALPLHARTILQLEDGFSSEALLAEPIWVTAARAGKRALVLQATHTSPLTTYEPGGRFGGPFQGSLTLLDGYAGEVARDGVHAESHAWRPAHGWNLELPAGTPMEQRLTVGGRPWWALAYDDPADPVVGYDTVGLTPHKATAWTPLKPGAWSNPVRLDTARGAAWLRFHLFELDPGLEAWSLYHTGASAPACNKPDAAAVWYGPDSPFVPQGPGRVWGKGLLGRTVFAGGEGTAERRYVTIVRHVLGHTRHRLERLMARQDWDLAVCYVPYPDEALHHWYGGLAPGAPAALTGGARAQLAARLDDVLRDVDEALTPLLEGQGTLVALASDHGMAATATAFHPNHVLRRAGLLTLDARGQVDLSRTQAFYPGADGGYVVVNHRGHLAGCVAKQDVGRVLTRVEQVLMAERGADGHPVVTRTFRRDAEEARLLGIGGPRAGDLYLDLAPGYVFDATVDASRALRPLEPGRAGHVFDPRRADMHAFMVLAGPGVKTGVALPPVTHADLAPTVAHLLGIPAPAHATGAVIRGALAPRE